MLRSGPGNEHFSHVYKFTCLQVGIFQPNNAWWKSRCLLRTKRGEFFFFRKKKKGEKKGFVGGGREGGGVTGAGNGIGIGIGYHEI